MYQVIMPVLSGFIGLLLAFLIALFIAPYKQRDDARKIIDDTTKYCPPHNRDALIKAMVNVKQTALSCFQFRSVGELIAKQKDKTLTNEDIWHATNDPTNALLNSIQNLDAEIAIAGKKHASIFDEVRNMAIFLFFIVAVLAMLNRIDENKKREMLDVEDDFDLGIDNAIGEMDGKITLDNRTYVLEKYMSKFQDVLNYDKKDGQADK